MKKILALIVAISMVFVACGCGKKVNPLLGNDDSSEKQEVNKNHKFATITMADGGTIKLELMPEYAPKTVENFLSLAKSGFYDGLIFHRVIPGFMIQGGDPEGTGFGGSDKYIIGEFRANGFTKNTLKHTRGVISMARSENPNTARSQFFIVHQTSPHLDGQYAAFGKVISGMAVVDKIASVQTDENDRPINDVVIKSIKVEE